MSTFRTILIATGCLLPLAGAYAASDWLKGSADEQRKTLSDIQPGLGTVLIEYSNRYSDMYYVLRRQERELAFGGPTSSKRREKFRKSEKRRG